MAVRPLGINHVEMIYEPGEREAAQALFELMGFGVSDFGPWLVVNVDPETGNGIDNVMYASEPVPAQQQFEDALQEALAAHEGATAALEHYRGVRVAHPQYNFHFGASVPTLEDWKERVARLEDAAANHPQLKGRFDLSVFNPGDPGAVGPQHQAFILTHILATGTLQTGLIFELQWTPTNDAGEIDFAELSAQSTAPDPLSIV
ncbi:MAG: hypothetical protein QM729_12700 [Solirubrobacterales bacterium]